MPEKLNFTDNQIQQMAKLYDSGKSLSDLARKYNCSLNGIWKTFIRHGIPRRTPNVVKIRKFLSRQEIDEVIRKYQNGMSTDKLASLYDCGSSTILRALVKRNITRRKSFDYFDTTRKIFFNQQFFDTIDTEAKAYWLGFMFADGCVKSNKRKMAFSLKLSDGYMVDNFAKYINYPIDKVCNRPRNDKSSENSEDTREMQFHSKHMATSLISHGCIPRKTYSMKFPNTVPSDLLEHFCRGYFDGDGCICTNGRSGWMVQICGTESFLLGFAGVLSAIGIIDSFGIYKRIGVHMLTFSKKESILKLRDWFYKDATIYLERKFKKFQEIV
jgi:intein-encoded DNA endonuclease-like protein